MFSNDLEYFAQRACEERERALAAPSPNIEAIHFELAAKYEALAAGHETPEQVRSSQAALLRSSELLYRTSAQIDGR
jgi:hypothetical protein